MSKLRTLITTLWISAVPLAHQSGRMLTHMSETGSAKPVAAAAAGAAAGGTLLAFFSRSCRFAGSLAGRSTVVVSESAALTMSERSILSSAVAARALSEAELGGAATARALAEAEELGMVATRPSNWRSVSGVIKETEVAKGLDEKSLLLKLQKDPEFRTKVFNEVAQKRPESIWNLSRYSSNRLFVPLENKPTLQSVIKSEPVDFYDSAGNALSKNIVGGIEAEYEKTATKFLSEALKRVPPSSYKSEAELKTALKEAFESTELTRKSEYSFNASSGRLELKFQSKYGEIKGRINAYNIAVLAGPLGASLWLPQTSLDDDKQTPRRKHRFLDPR